MRDRIISNVLIKMGSRIKKKELQFLENVYAHPHKFRRTLCTNLIMRGMPLQNVAILMGHADINMTANVYYDASDWAIEYEYIRYAA